MKRIGVIGAGKAGEAILTGLLNSGYRRNLIKCSDIDKIKRNHITERLKIESYKTNTKLVKNSDIVVIAVPPRNIENVLHELEDVICEKHLVISIVAGLTTIKIFNTVGRRFKLIRAMPNNPCLVGEGMTVLAPTELVSDEDVEKAKRLFTSIGRVAIAPEEYLNAVTGLSGSGPAYIYLIIEALADGGVKMGIKKDLSLLLAAQTVLGSAKMVLETNKHPSELKDMVATPGGTTVQGLHALEKQGVRAALITAVEEATKKAKELN